MNESCPAGIDIPTYLALIAQGKDPQAIIEGGTESKKRPQPPGTASHRGPGV